MEEANRQLQALVAQIAATEPNATTGTTTEGGFQTKEDLFQRDNPAIEALKPHIFSAMQEYASQTIRQEVTRAAGAAGFRAVGLGGVAIAPAIPRACTSIPTPMSAASIM